MRKDDLNNRAYRVSQKIMPGPITAYTQKFKMWRTQFFFDFLPTVMRY